MENKTLFEIDTAWPFPILQYTANTSYVEVRKASGIAYILLQLIINSENNSEKMIVMLRNLGVPDDIHYIFAGELSNMIRYKIISMKSGRTFSSDLIDRYVVSDFEITDLGRKLFADGTIPTGNTKSKKIWIYYDVAKKDTQAKFNLSLYKLENSVLDKECVGDVVLNNSDVEMFITENMSRILFKKGERISGFEHEQPETLVYKVENAVTLRVTSESVQIQAKDKERDAFIHKNYSAEAITKIMDAKKKYRFPESVKADIEEYEYQQFTNVVKVNIPSQFATVTNVKSQLALAGSCEIKGSECSIEKSESVEIMQKCNIQGVACYFENGKLYAIVPGRFWVNIEGYSDKCALNLILVQQLEEEVKQQLMREVFMKCMDAEEPFKRCSVIRKLTQISNCKDYLEQFAKGLLCNVSTCTEKINLFLKLDEEFSGVTEWSDYAKLNAGYLFDELCESVSAEGFAAQNILGKKLKKILGFHDIEYLSKMARKLIEIEGDVVAFETLEGAGYNTDVVLSVVNVFELYCKQILEEVHISGKSKLSGQCVLFGQTLSELKDITGIENPYEDSAELDFDYDRFVQVMATFTDSLKKLEKYRAYAMEQFKVLNAFQERFIEVKEVVTIEKEALRNPKNISNSYIEQRLKKSRYKDAICDLHVRLQYELNRLFNTENVHTFDLLSDENITNYLSEEEISSMHELRKCRNGFQHPKERRDVQYSERIIRGWCAVVEKLGGMDNEPRSED